jgi:hypothetical protein
MRLLVAQYPDGHVELWAPEMQETLENLPEPRPVLLGIVSPSYAEVSEPEPV